MKVGRGLYLKKKQEIQLANLKKLFHKKTERKPSAIN